MGQTTFMRAKTGIVDAEKLIGCKVENLQGESLGKIETLIVDLREGRVTAAILSFGGFLGLGEKLYPVPLGSITFKPEDERCVMDMDKEALKRAPAYSRGEWPDWSDREWIGRVYQHYNATPYW